MAPLNPLTLALREGGIPEYDFGVLAHGWLPHGRDYALTLQSETGTYSILFTHVVRLTIETRVRDDVWPRSWDDVFLDYARSVDLDGYVWGTNWSLAYPGFDIPEVDGEAASWSERVGKPMHRASLETDRFLLSLIFHSVRVRQETEDVSLIKQVFIPLD